MVNQPHVFKSDNLPLWMKIALVLLASLGVSLLVIIIMVVFDGRDWHIVTGGIWVNLVFIWVASMIMSLFYYKNEFASFRKNTYVFSKTHYQVFQDNQLVRTYPLHMLIRLRVDHAFYGFFGYKKLTVVLQPMKGSRVQIEVLLLKKSHLKTLHDDMLQCFSNPTKKSTSSD